MKYLLIIVALLYAFLLIFFRLSEIPGLHGDEAWFGLYASKILKEGLNSFHGMNTYTSSLYSFVISLIFKFGGASVFNLRLTGAILNFLGLILLAININKFLGKESLFILFIIIFSSPQFFLNSRIAWEVYSLQFFLISVRISILLKVLKYEKIAFLDYVIFLTVSLLGVLNHFIFISESLALLLSVFIANLIIFKEPKKSQIIPQIFYLSLVNMIFVTIVFKIKPRIGNLFFQDNTLFIATSFVLLVIGLSFVLWKLNTEKSHFILMVLYNKIRETCKRYIRLLTWVNVSLFLLGLIGITFFKFTILEKVWGRLFRIYMHMWGFLGTITSTLPIQRILVHKLSFFELGVFHLFWIVILVLFFIAMLMRIWRRDQNLLESYKNLIFYFYPLFALLVLCLFVAGTSERYYMISCYLMLIACSIIWSDIKNLFRFSKRIFLYLMVLLASLNFWVGQVVLYKLALFDPQREHFIVSYIEYRDTSKHFLDSRNLFRFLKEKRVCDLVDTNYFIEKPMSFYRLKESNSCDQGIVAKVRYCKACQKPVKYYSVEIRERD